jgi:hypothetical protein
MGRGRRLYCLSDDERADIEAALEEVERDEVASDAEVAAVFNRNRAAPGGVSRRRDP